MITTIQLNSPNTVHWPSVLVQKTSDSIWRDSILRACRGAYAQQLVISSLELAGHRP